MKAKYYMYALLLGITPFFFSCTNDDKPSEKGEGFLQLDLSINEQQREIFTKSVETDVNDLAVSVMLGTKEVACFTSYQELKEMGTLRLETGSYTVIAHSPGEMEEISADPYYYAEKDFEIRPNMFAEAKVICNMANAGIRIVLSEELLSAIDDDFEVILTVDGTEQEYTSFTDGISENWYFAPATEISFLMRGKTVDGEDFVTDEPLSKGVSANDFLTIQVGTATKATRSAGSQEMFNIKLSITQ